MQCAQDFKYKNVIFLQICKIISININTKCNKIVMIGESKG